MMGFIVVFLSCGNCQVGTLNDADMDNLADEGEIVMYTIDITNKGNVRMGDIQVRVNPLQNHRQASRKYFGHYKESSPKPFPERDVHAYV